MNLVINGKPEELNEKITVLELLKIKGVASPDLVTVELNETIIQRPQFESTELKENDSVEFLFLMAGGA